MFRAVIYDPQPSITALEMSPEFPRNPHNCKRLFLIPKNDGQALPDGCHLETTVFALSASRIINELSFCLLVMLEAAASYDRRRLDRQWVSWQKARVLVSRVRIVTSLMDRLLEFTSLAILVATTF